MTQQQSRIDLPAVVLSVRSKQVIDADKNEQRVPINNLGEIYKQADRLKATVGSYVNNSRQSSSA